MLVEFSYKCTHCNMYDREPEDDLPHRDPVNIGDSEIWIEAPSLEMEEEETPLTCRSCGEVTIFHMSPLVKGGISPEKEGE